MDKEDKEQVQELMNKLDNIVYYLVIQGDNAELHRTEILDAVTESSQTLAWFKGLVGLKEK